MHRLYTITEQSMLRYVVKQSGLSDYWNGPPSIGVIYGENKQAQYFSPVLVFNPTGNVYS